MVSDPRDYKLDLSSAKPQPEDDADAGNSQRPFVSVNFACCGVYQRIYRAADGKSYTGRCPRCGKPVKFIVGEGGTAARFFTVT
jgi:hypothetical protein